MDHDVVDQMDVDPITAIARNYQRQCTISVAKVVHKPSLRILVSEWPSVRGPMLPLSQPTSL